MTPTCIVRLGGLHGPLGGQHRIVAPPLPIVRNILQLHVARLRLGPYPSLCVQLGGFLTHAFLNLCRAQGHFVSISQAHFTFVSSKKHVSRSIA
jgi:hypothetical protein